ncbi:MAG: UbiA family prenyltransferase [Halobellus sp.]|uniref:UbiA family prenyltransferase n=1 Tax=Halobellus sp. TaxID=1979212 RepID=UPI0035D45141
MYSTVHLVLIAMIESAIVATALSVPIFPAAVVVGLLTFAVYAGDRIADADTDELTNPRQSAFIRRHETILSVLTAGSYGLALTISLTGGPLTFGLTLLPGAFWILYGSDWLPTLSSGLDRLKNVLLVNSTLVAFGWAVTLTFLPLTFAEAAFSPTAAVVFVYFLVDRFINTEIPNVADMEGDDAIDVATLPTVVGVDRTRQLLYVLSLGLATFLVLAFLFELLSVTLTVALLVGIGYSLCAIGCLGRIADHRSLTVASNVKHLVVFAVFLGFLVTGM